MHVIGAHLRAADGFISSKSEGLNLGITILRRLKREDRQDLASVGYAWYIEVRDAPGFGRGCHCRQFPGEEGPASSL